jgi:uncharacterized protein (TIGR00369 family)
LTSEVRARPAGKRDREGAFEFEPHHCFACGELNEHGLHLQLHTSPVGSWTELTLATAFQGWDSVAHGGIVCTLLDEVMAWAVIGRGTWGVTARMNVTFRRPIRTGQDIRVEGWVLEEGRRAAKAAGHVLDVPTGEILATGESTFVAVPPDQLARLQSRYGMRRAGTTEGGAAAPNAGDGADAQQPARGRALVEGRR